MSDKIVAGLPENALEPLLKRLNEKCSRCGQAAWGFVKKTQISSEDYLTYVCTVCGEVKRSLRVAHLILEEKTMKVLHDMTTEWKTEVKCDECKSVMEIDQHDLMIGEFGGSYCEHGDLHTYVRCPCCKNCILVNTPSWLFRRVQKKENTKK